MSKLTPTKLSPSSTVYHWIPSNSGSAELRTSMFKCIPHFSEGAIFRDPKCGSGISQMAFDSAERNKCLWKMRLAHVQKYFLPSWYVRKAKDDIVQKLLLLFLRGAVEEERSSVITNRLWNPALPSAANYHFLISCRVSYWHAGKAVCVQA